MDLLECYNDLVETMQKYDLYQKGDEVDMALESLKEAINESSENQLIKKLDTYLCGDWNELLLMYDNIKNEVNQSCVIDHVDDVQTAEQFEYTFTCRDFIALIES